MTIIANPVSGKIVGQETRKRRFDAKIRMRNRVQFDGWKSLDQLYDVEVHEKGDFQLLLFINEEEKSGSQVSWSELVMTRFSSPKPLCDLSGISDSLAYIPTPMGMQEFIIQTNHYKRMGKRLS